MCILCEKLEGKISNRWWNSRWPSETINIDSCQKITRLPSLPKKTRKLCINHCLNLTALENLPEGLTELILFETGVATIDKFPSGLINLSIYFSQISTLPKFPQGIQYINLCQLPIKRIPEIPSSVEELTISFCEKMVVLPFCSPLVDLSIFSCYWLEDTERKISVIRNIQKKYLQKLYLRYLHRRHCLKKLLPPYLAEEVLKFVV